MGEEVALVVSLTHLHRSFLIGLKRLCNKLSRIMVNQISKHMKLSRLFSFSFFVFFLVVVV